VVQPRKSDVQRQHHRQHELVHGHRPRQSLNGECFLDQPLESELLQHGRNGQQTAVRSQMAASEVIRRGRIDFKGFRTNRANPLRGTLFLVILAIVIHLLGGS
jgi:hypothetical protein